MAMTMGEGMAEGEEEGEAEGEREMRKVEEGEGEEGMELAQ